jgi:CspA family cold shock protein
MRGTMLWFNAAKGYGFISTEDEERLLVETGGFADGELPKGRCAGRTVIFDLHAGDGEPQAVGVRFESLEEPRRARRRSRGL